MKKIIPILILLTVLVGCGKTETVQTVDWYKSHNAERNDMLKKCSNNPGELRATPNCLNAKAAANALIWGSRNID